MFDKESFLFFLFCLVVIILVQITGCGKHCISISGSKDDYSGRVEYCYSPEKSARFDAPTFISKDGMVLVALTQEEIDVANSLIGVKSSGMKNDNVESLLAKLRASREKK